MNPFLISPNIDINAVRSSVEGSINEVKGAILSKAQSVETLASSLAGPELIQRLLGLYFLVQLAHRPLLTR